MNKKGVTIIELLVAMTIFIIIVTLAVGAFATVSRMKALTSTMKEAQQKIRISTEMLTRIARQADRVYVSNFASNDNTVQIYYKSNTTGQYGYQFKLINVQNGYGDLELKECTPNSPKLTDSSQCNWDLITNASNLSGGILKYKNYQSVDGKKIFGKTGTIPSMLTINLDAKIEGINSNPYYSDKINIESAVILEGLK